MRICVFSPDAGSLASPEWRARLEADVGAGHDIVPLTNSWAALPAESDAYVTGGTERLGMRAARKIFGAPQGSSSVAWRGVIAAPFVRAAGGDLLEGLRAADPDLIVSLHRGWTEVLRRRIRGLQPAWPCMTLGDPVPGIEPTWRRYDPSVKISVVLPTYNGVRYLADSIRSCLDQTHSNLELIVVDDGSRDEIGAIVAAFDDPRLVCVRHARNQGLPRALNTGFRRVTGEFCSWTSDDNRYEPDAFARMLAFLQTYPGVDFVYAESYRSDGSAEDEVRARPLSVMRPRPPDSLFVDNFIGACFLYKRLVYQRIGDFNPKAALAEDYEYWVRVHQHFVMQRLFAPLYTYRFHSQSLTSIRTPEEVARTVLWVKQAHGIGERS